MFFYTRKLPGRRVEVKLNSSYILQEDNDLCGFMEALVPLIQNKNQLNSFPKQFEICLYPSLQMKLANKTQQTCLICIQPIICKKVIEEQLEESSSKDGYCLKCKHVFHKGCLEQYINKNSWFNCPKCMKMYGKMVGSMPEGIMTSMVNESMTCPGANSTIIIIKYEIFDGQIDEQQYSGATFYAYLPNNEQGHKLLKMLKQCFRRRLTFTVKKNQYKKLVVEWAEIPHKTSIQITANQKNGYPDETYVQRTINFIKSFGISQ